MTQATAEGYRGGRGVPDLRQVLSGDERGQGPATFPAQAQVDEGPEAQDQHDRHAPAVSHAHPEAEDREAGVADGDVQHGHEQLHEACALVVAAAAKHEPWQARAEGGGQYQQAIKPEDDRAPARPHEQLHEACALVVAAAAKHEPWQARAEGGGQYQKAVEPEDDRAPARPAVNARPILELLYERGVVANGVHPWAVLTDAGESEAPPLLALARLAAQQNGGHAAPAGAVARLRTGAGGVEARARVLVSAAGAQADLARVRARR
eukprot:CAMPEP_0198606998 /NCGR_PEP_ID=MMETSP1462-20131121/155171_1 /TAXON_ID=1333877 /ORGANISM="Brandtodinium nutriculum, Strain RCC3387" /LENGTH=264 /DNA_ID=CAMNT_0044338805 /DNA_START=695 /DNA_END=1487 /DNA_ORIENTATION=-